ncbi:MAG: Ig domain-containing protein, partial [Verrucomicrobia bacterium]|nr:Ig domain-containing protein [Verrucomicrobiota bacterium]
MNHFALKLLDSDNVVINTITETDIHFPYTDPVAAGGYGSIFVKVMASFPPIAGQHFLAEFTQAEVHGIRVIEMDANGQPSVPTVISGATTNGQEGKPFSYRIMPSAITTFFDAIGLPAGLALNRTNGLISGTPAGFGKVNVTLLVGNAYGTNTANLALTIAPAATIQIAASTNPGNTTDDVFAKAIPDLARSSPTSYDLFYVSDIFGSATGNFEPGNCVFADGGPGSVQSV